MSLDQLPLPTLGPAPLVPGAVFVCFEVTGEPEPKARHRSRIGWKNGKPFVMTYPDPDTVRYERLIGQIAALHMRGRKPTDKPLALLVHAFKSIPESWSLPQREAALAGEIRPAGHVGDVDNFYKVAADAMNRIIYQDDCQIIDGRCLKYYSNSPALRIEVREFVTRKV